MIVAIHQPNYLPWLGYFAKMAQADIFVLLDDVQFSKGSYTNRVQIAREGRAVWLSQPVRHDFGALIKSIAFARPDWARAHADSIRQAYRHASFYTDVWPHIEHALLTAKAGLAVTNAGLIGVIADRLGLSHCRLLTSSCLPIQSATHGDQRLADIVAHLAPGGTYLSGAGGAKYQAESTFAAHGLALAYSSFTPQPYARSGETFVPGLSVLDALFHIGWRATADLIRPRP